MPTGPAPGPANRAGPPLRCPRPNDGVRLPHDSAGAAVVAPASSLPLAHAIASPSPINPAATASHLPPVRESAARTPRRRRRDRAGVRSSAPGPRTRNRLAPPLKRHARSRFPRSPSRQKPRRRRRISPPPEAVAVDRRRHHHCNRRSTPPLPVLFAASRDARSRRSGRDRSRRHRPPRLW